ncbi:holotricin-1 [Periplaneta americana]|uniref:holotricin-1 n=1 Tax=Periplaneta americana TaxID=6978 RepID=UPI0037E73DC9
MKQELLILLLLACSLVSGAPAESEHVRIARATCDLASIQIAGFKAGDSLCAAHCLAMRRGFRGGHCKKGVCHCRK